LILQRGSLRRRPPVALELAIRTGGRYDVATGAFSVQQRRELTGFATVAGARLACDGWLPTS
jgi:hypothetical protein